jgi:hypothetical protein
MAEVDTAAMEWADMAVAVTAWVDMAATEAAAMGWAMGAV